MPNLTSITLSASGNVTSSGQFSTLDNSFGTAGTSNANVLTVQGIAGGVNQPVTVANANSNGRVTPANSAPVVLASQTYTSVAANSTTTQLGTTGASGDFIDGLTIIPASTNIGSVAILDVTTSITVVNSGATALTNLVPFYIPLGVVSRNGAGGWKVTTGSSVAVIANGNFT